MSEVILSRRGFLSGLAGLVTVIAVDPGSLIPGMAREAAEASARERLVDLIRRTGIVENQTFIFTERTGVVFENVPGLLIKNCRFEWPNALNLGESGLTFGKACGDMVFVDVHFDLGELPPHERHLENDRVCMTFNPNYPEPIKHNYGPALFGQDTYEISA